MCQRGGNYVSDRWTRLPVFLQQAGRFEEAMQEFNRLLSEVGARVKNEFPDSATPEMIEKYIQLNQDKIYDKMQMVRNRQKRLDKLTAKESL
jgi:hypothetical protein